MKRPAKKYIFLAAAMILLLAAAVGSTMAFFSKEATSHNVITMGNIRIALHDAAEKKSGVVMPGDTLQRTVTVENTGTHPAFVRIHFENGFGAEEEKDSFVAIDFNDTDWVQYGDFWYYRNALEAGAETEPLFTKVTFLDGMDSTVDGAEYDIRFTAYAVQQENNGDDPFRALGWPGVK